MTLKEQLYKFDNLDIHSAIIIQQSLENRKNRTVSITKEGSEIFKKSDKAIIDEIDQMYDDLDRHISAQVRMQERTKKGADPSNKTE